MHLHDASEPYSPAERIYASWRLRIESQGSTETFEALCAAHPALGSELRALHADAVGLDGVARAAVLGTSEDERASREQAARALQDLARLGAVGGRYAIGVELGRGGMGSVHEARDLLLDRVVACKRIADPAAAARLLPLFRREMRIAARLSHAAVAGIHDAGIDADGRAYFTMPLIRGRNLSEVERMVARGEDGWSVVRAVSVLLQVADAMAYVHAQGVVHRDLKPGNIRVGEYGEVHVMDWGIAKLAEDPQDAPGGAHEPRRAQADNSGGAGTPPYMSPEQWRAGGVVGPASDVHALGVMLYELLAGRPPHHEEGEGRVDSAVLWRRMQSGPPRPIQSIARAQPAELCSICEKAMERDLAKRYPDCVALAADLRAFLEGRVVAAHETGSWAETKKWVRRNKAFAGAVGAAIVASLVGTLAFRAKAEEADANRFVALAERDRANEQKRLAEEGRDAVVKQQYELALRSLGREADVLQRRLKDRDTTISSALWMASAGKLVDGGVDASGRPTPGLRDVRQRLAELRQPERYAPYDEVARQRDFLNHPLQKQVHKLKSRRENLEADLSAAITALSNQAEWTDRMLGRKPWPDKERYARAMQAEMAELDPRSLRRQATLNARGTDRSYGRETRALVYAERAVEEAGPDEELEARIALAWALWATGQHGLAKSSLEALRDELPPELKGPASEALLAVQAEQARFEGEERAKRESDVARWKEEIKRRRKGLDAEVAKEESAIDAEVARLEAACGERRTWRMTDPGDEALHRLLEEAEARLVDLQALLDAQRQPDPARRWSEALQAIAKSPRYAGVRWPGGVLAPQVGLLPLEEDPRSGLWEFHMPATGAEPARDAQGRLARDEEGRLRLQPETGIVFVLLPGGRVRPVEAPPSKRYYQEEWVTSFDLEPWFMAKHEMTCAQWHRLAGTEPDPYDRFDQDLLPVSQPSWNQLSDLWSKLPGPIGFPSALQWEFAMRGGTNTIYWTGNDDGSLLGAEVLKNGRTQPDTLPVGSLRANPYGLHDMLGNVTEMCGDAGASDDEFLTSEWVQKVPPRAGDGMKLLDAATFRLTAGGGAWMEPFGAQMQLELDPTERDSNTGVRPAMRVLP